MLKNSQKSDSAMTQECCVPHSFQWHQNNIFNYNLCRVYAPLLRLNNWTKVSARNFHLYYCLLIKNWVWIFDRKLSNSSLNIQRSPNCTLKVYNCICHILHTLSHYHSCVVILFTTLTVVNNFLWIINMLISWSIDKLGHGQPLQFIWLFDFLFSTIMFFLIKTTSFCNQKQ